MSNLRVRWTLPAVAADQRPLVFTAVEMRSDASFPFDEVARVPANAAPVTPADTVLLPNLADGTYEVRLRCNDGTDFGDYSLSTKITLVTAPPVVRAPDAPSAPVLSQE